MKRVIQFTKLRILMFILSGILIVGGIAGIFVRGGFNLGIDFQAGLNMRVQMAQEAFSLTYTGEGEASANVSGAALIIDIAGTDESGRYEFPFDEYETVGSIANAVSDLSVVAVTLNTAETAATERIVGFSHSYTLGEEPVYVNMLPADESGIFASIDQVRESVSELGATQIQAIGDPIDQEYIIRVEDPGDDRNFDSNVSNRLMELLSRQFGSTRVIQKQTDYVGPRYSRELGSQVIFLTLFAMALILVYIWFRFRLAYAVSSIIALAHDVAIMLGFIAVLQLEVSTATIAAVLTIIGYSLNDTIVIFDRVRENSALLRDSDFETIINTSVTQSLSRTLLTSLTTMLGVVAIFIFGTGTIKDFALNLMIGIVVGTYSSIFIASPILLGWTNARDRKRKRKDFEKYGRRGETAKPVPAAEGKAEEAAPPEAEDTEAAEKQSVLPTAPTPKERKPQGKKRQKSKKKKKK